MRTNKRWVLAAAVALMATSASAMAAQQTQQEREKAREEARVQEAQQRLQEAQAELQRALQYLQQEESRDAQRALQESMSQMQKAMRQLNRDRMTIAFGSLADVGGVSIVSRASGPKMGVYLNTERNASIDSIGAELSSVVSDGPAHEAGLREGDIITVANGESLARTSRRGQSPGNKLIEIKDELEVGDTLHVEYMRGSETHTANIVLDDLGGTSWTTSSGWATPEIVVAPRVRVEGPRGVTVRAPTMVTEFYGRTPWGWLDVELVTLDEDLGGYFGTTEGLLVVRGSEEGEIDLRSGDVILSVDGRVPTSQAHLLRIMRSYEEGEEMSFEIMRDKSRQSVSFTIPERDEGFLWRPDWEF